MSTANFYAMENFPLFARDFTETFGYCPDCQLLQDQDNDCCEDCGGELEERDMPDEIECEYVCDAVDTAMNRFNDDLLFHKLSLLSGYYSGVQFCVEELYENVYSLSNCDCRYYFDMYRSVALRKYEGEQRKINRFMYALAAEYGFEQYYRFATFSNGETIYHKVEKSQRSRLLQAISPVA